MGRAELLSSLFFLLALLTYHKLQDSDKWKQLISTLLLCLCSFLSKEQGIMTAGVCLTYEVFIMNKVRKIFSDSCPRMCIIILV